MTDIFFFAPPRDCPDTSHRVVRRSAGRAAFEKPGADFGFLVLVTLLVLTFAADTRAETEGEGEPAEDEHPHRLQISGGLGYAFPLDDDASDVGAEGVGAYGRVEYIYRAIEALTPRAYAGVVFAPNRAGCDVSPCDVSARIFFMGLKARLLAPIPYVAPFIELGAGASLGTLSTRVGQFVDASTSGATYHIPFGVGLALGEQHQYELAFQYLFHPEVHQYSGGFVFGFEFPLR